MSVSATSLPQIALNVDLREKFQTVEGFGASDAWSTEVVGATFADATKEKAAKWLFSSKIDSKGNCEGIGLSIWRFCLGPFGNMPAGSVFIPQDYLDSNGNYNWNVNPGKQWFLDKAIEYGCDQIGAWSACILPQLRPDGMTETSYKNYAVFLADIISHYNDLGYKFKYIAPVNEPQYDWTEGEVKWTSSRISAMTSAVCSEFLERGLDTPVFLGEAADWGNLYDTNDTESNWARNQIYNYFDEKSPLYIGDYSNLLKEFAAHSYWTDQSNTRLKDFRSKAKEKADLYGIKLHQTEWSMLSNPPIEGLPGTPSDMDYALLLAKVVYSDMVFAGVSSWTYWEAFGVGEDARFHLINTNNIDKSFKVRKNLWSLGNYSLFIRPGYQRVLLSGADDMNGLMGTAYISPENDKMVVVLVNMGAATNISLSADLDNNLEIVKTEKYVTSSMFDLQLMPVNSLSQIPVLPKSVTTLVCTLESGSGLETPMFSDKKTYSFLNNVIDFGNTPADEAVLYDMSGRILSSYNTTSSIDLNGFDRGVYFLKIRYGGVTKIEDFLVK